MKILAIDTAEWKCSAALWENEQDLAFLETESERDQAAYLPQLITKIIGQHHIDQIIVNIGPGSFTGIRIGLAFARGLAMGWNIPLIGMDSFSTTYVNLDIQEDILILIEARRQDVFGRYFRNGIPDTPRSFTREEIEKILSVTPSLLLAGSGVHPLLEGLTFKEIFSPWKGAQGLAHAFFKKSSIASPPFPFYVREPDVTYASESCRLPH